MSLVNWKSNAMRPRFNSFLDSFFEDSEFLPTKSAFEALPPTNIEENPESFIIKMAVPGLEKDDIIVEINKNVLNISAKTEREEEVDEKNFTRKEYSYSSFKRSFVIPENVLTEKIFADSKKGELILTLPKMEIEVSKPKQIEVK